jgi:cyclase
MPCLLLRNRGLVKTIKFRNASYIGDPVNTVRIYNEQEVDELVFLDITATTDEKEIQFEVIEEIAGECYMPVTYGGGIRSLDQMSKIFSLGVEKVVINTAAVDNPEVISEAARRFGSQSIVVSMDVKRRFLGGYEIFTHGGTRRTRLDPIEHAMRMSAAGAGELLVTSIDRDGTMSGYDLELTRAVSDAVEVPVIACGGAGSIDDFALAVQQGGASAVAAGSLVVYQGTNRSVLINFPAREELESVLA